jgi:hypothetical protein
MTVRQVASHFPTYIHLLPTLLFFSLSYVLSVYSLFEKGGYDVVNKASGL